MLSFGRCTITRHDYRHFAIGYFGMLELGSPICDADIVAWRLLLPSILIILIDVLCVNIGELAHMKITREQQCSLSDYVLGCAMAIAGVVTWTWYTIVNSRYLKANPQISSTTWASAQGLATLPLALIGSIGYFVYLNYPECLFVFVLAPSNGVYRPDAVNKLMLIMVGAALLE